MRTAPVKAIVLPTVYRANLEFQSHVPFQHLRTGIIDLRTRGRQGFCTLVHSLLSDFGYEENQVTHALTTTLIVNQVVNLSQCSDLGHGVGHGVVELPLHPFLPMVHWGSRLGVLQFGMFPLCPLLPMVHWDGMDSGDAGMEWYSLGCSHFIPCFPWYIGMDDAGMEMVQNRKFPLCPSIGVYDRLGWGGQ